MNTKSKPPNLPVENAISGPVVYRWMRVCSGEHGRSITCGRAVDDPQVVGAGAAVVGGRAVIPDHHHLLGGLKVPHRAHVALAAVLPGRIVSGNCGGWPMMGKYPTGKHGTKKKKNSLHTF